MDPNSKRKQRSWLKISLPIMVALVILVGGGICIYSWNRSSAGVKETKSSTKTDTSKPSSSDETTPSTISNCKHHGGVDSAKTVAKVMELINKASKIVVLAGAGLSVAAGIPDFRSPNTGLYARVKERFPELNTPEDLFRRSYLLTKSPEPFYQVTRELLTTCETVQPTSAHRFLKHLEDSGKLLMLFTQNIDTLDEKMGITKRINCHGSFDMSTCLHCGHLYTFPQLKKLLQDQPNGPIHCSHCESTIGLVNEDEAKLNSPDERLPNLVKPNVVLFGESLPPEFFQQLDRVKDETDLVLVMGTSLGVAPVSAIPSHIREGVPLVLLNLQSVRTEFQFDVCLLGDIQQIVTNLSSL